MERIKTIKKQVVVIGSGSAGLTAAIGLSKVGYSVTIIEKGYIGGDCTNFGCIPSKALLHRAHEVGIAKRLETTIDHLDPLEGARLSRQEFREHESEQWLNENGVSLIKGRAKFESNHSLSVEQSEGNQLIITFDLCVIATGSSPIIPDVKGLRDTQYLTNETIFELGEVPRSLAVIGDGPIGLEMADAFSNLGCEVTVIGQTKGILKRAEPELATMLEKYLSTHNSIKFLNSIESVSEQNNQFNITLKDQTTFKADKLLVATGRKPNINLDLDKAGIKFDHKGIYVKRTCVTSNPKVFAIGDCCDVPRFTHMAGHMGRTLVPNLTIKKYLKVPIYPFRYSINNIPAVTFTSPELAQSGLTTPEAETKYGKTRVKIYKLLLSDEDRLKAQNHEIGQINLVTVGPLAKIIGVHILSNRAGEILPEFQLMIAKGMRIKDLGQFIRAYPSYITRVDQLKLEWIRDLFMQLRP